MREGRLFLFACLYVRLTFFFVRVCASCIIVEAAHVLTLMLTVVVLCCEWLVRVIAGGHALQPITCRHHVQSNAIVFDSLFWLL